MAEATGVVVQVNIKDHSGDLFNVYGRTEAEFSEGLMILKAYASEIAEVQSLLKAVGAVTQHIPVTAAPALAAVPALAPPTNGWSQPAPPVQSSPESAKACIHGPAKTVPAGVSKKTGAPYNAFQACPAGVNGCKVA